MKRTRAAKVVISGGAKLWRARVYDASGSLMSQTEVGPDGRWGPGRETLKGREFVEWWANEYFPGVPVEHS